MASSKMLLAALCVLALLAVRSESHGLEDFTGGAATSTPAMQNFFKPEAAALPEALDASSMPAATMAAKPEATAIPTTTTTTTDASANSAATAGTVPRSSATPRRSVSVAAGVACGVAALAVVGILAAVAYVVRGRRGARRGTEVQLGSSP